MRKHIVAVGGWFIVALAASAQTANPSVVFYSTDEGADVEMSPGDEQSAPAPLDIKMYANLEDNEGWDATCEWKLYSATGTETDALIDRYEENTSYTLNQSGGYYIKLYVTFTNSDEETVEYESEVFQLSITTSKLSCPDGFSPNGDGINDVFKVTYQSIISMQGSIFNRWGKKIYSFDLGNVDKGWDGVYNGKYVKDGVYFLNLQATGSDGVKYNIKKAINVMKGLRDYDE